MFAWKVSKHLKTLVRFQGSQPLIKSQQGVSKTVSPLVFKKALDFVDREALRDCQGTYTYGNILSGAKELAAEISKQCDGLVDQRILFMCPNDASYLITQWAIWISGNIAIPFSRNIPESLINYFCQDAQARLIITTSANAKQLHPIAKYCSSSLLVLDDQLRENCLQKEHKFAADLEGIYPGDFYKNRDALIIYTSGTTSKSKGVVLTHKNVTNQIKVISEAWKFDPKDCVLHALPLNHIHGVVNALLCPLYVGGSCAILPKFDAAEVWSKLLGLNKKEGDLRVTVFMGVPTMYVKLIEEYEKLFKDNKKMRDYINSTMKSRMRLMISGSAALPHTVRNFWSGISGHEMLERYGMTEIGMCLSQVYDGQRDVGDVGIPLPGVSVRLVEKSAEENENHIILLEASNTDGDFKVDVAKHFTSEDDPIGELHVKSDSVFREYYNKPEITRREFTADNWFKTGDICRYSRSKQVFTVLGRASMDIIKSGGFKVSALEVESGLMNHPNVNDCAVVGLEDKMYGEIIGAALVIKSSKDFNLNKLDTWAKQQLPSYSVPRVFKIVEKIPKNALGKVNKVEVARLFDQN